MKTFVLILQAISLLSLAFMVFFGTELQVIQTLLIYVVVTQIQQNLLISSLKMERLCTT
jgi:hypothetical protein